MRKRKSSAAIQRERAARTKARSARSRAAKLGHARRLERVRDHRAYETGTFAKATRRNRYVRERLKEMIEQNDQRWLDFQRAMQKMGFSGQQARNFWFSPPPAGLLKPFV